MVVLVEDAFRSGVDDSEVSMNEDIHRFIRLPSLTLGDVDERVLGILVEETGGRFHLAEESNHTRCCHSVTP